LVLLEQVPAPQLASPLCMTFFFATGFAGAGAALVAGAVALAAATATGASVVGVVAAAAVVAGAAGLAAGIAAAFAPLLAPQPAAEQEACPATAGADIAGATSFAWTGCGWLPPQATRVVAPIAPRTAAKCSKDRFGLMTVLLTAYGFMVPQARGPVSLRCRR
jgi:hypothetical protein